MGFEVDLDELFSEDDHAIKFTFNGRTFTGIKNEEFTGSETGADGRDRSSPVLYAQTAHVKTAQIDDIILIDRVEHYVVANHPDGTGVSILELSLDSLG